MFKNYFNIAFRNLWRNRVSSLINLLGLALGIACCLIISLYVKDEVSFDNYHTNKDRIFRLSNTLTLSNTEDIAVVGLNVAPTLQRESPEIEAYCRFFSVGGNVTMKYGDKMFNESQVYMADSTVFGIFDYKLKRGNPLTALSRPRTAVFPEGLAKKYFGEEDPIGKQIHIGQNDYEITGIMEEIPANTDFRFSALLSLSSFPAQAKAIYDRDWMRMCNFTYFLFQENADASGFQDKLDEFASKYVQPWLDQNDVKGSMSYRIHPLSSLHFDNSLSYDTPKGNREYLFIFSLVAVFILLIACINYINLSIAQSAKRSMEVGIRKTTGARRSQLMMQFLGESLIISLLGLGLAVILVELALPIFNSLSEKRFGFADVFEPGMLLMMVGIVLFIGLIAGSYPAVYLANLKPVLVLKGVKKRAGGNNLRKFLVILQFTISIAMIISSLVIVSQMRYLRDYNLGFDQDQMMVLEVGYDTSMVRKFPQIKERLEQHPAVLKLATSNGNSVPGNRPGTLLFRAENKEGLLEEKGFHFLMVDEEYLNTMDIQILDGRNFELSRQTDRGQAFLVNEQMVAYQGWDDPIGKRIQWGLAPNDSATYDGKVIGVVKDFHFTSLHNSLEPMIIIFNQGFPSRLLVKLDKNNLSEGIDFVKEQWTDFDPNHPLSYTFLDERFAAQYRSEEKRMAIFGYFTLITIFIACMGLFGLSAFITQQRTKEIGIRKIMGAELPHIIYLLSKDFAILVLISLVIASGIAGYGMHNWLQEFAYHESLSASYFFISGITALMIAFLTISYHTLQAGRSNPVEALRYE